MSFQELLFGEIVKFFGDGMVDVLSLFTGRDPNRLVQSGGLGGDTGEVRVFIILVIRP